MIKVENLHKYFGDLEVLKGVNAKIDKSEVVCVIGPSGSGKSTFLRCLNLLEVPPPKDRAAAAVASVGRHIRLIRYGTKSPWCFYGVMFRICPIHSGRQ